MNTTTRKRTYSDDNADFLTIQQVCKRLNLGLSTARKLVEQTNTKIKIGRAVRVDFPRLVAILQAQEQAGR